jgi:hypothetical protein
MQEVWEVETMVINNELWLVRDGSIFVDKLVKKVSTFDKGPTFWINPPVAFNVGDAVARHIVETHNSRVMWQRENRS